MYPREEFGRWMPGEVAVGASQVGREDYRGAGATGGARRAFGGSAAERSGHGPRGVRVLRSGRVRAQDRSRVTHMFSCRGTLRQFEPALGAQRRHPRWTRPPLAELLRVG